MAMVREELLFGLVSGGVAGSLLRWGKRIFRLSRLATSGAAITLKSASETYKGTTRLGHALSKHSFRNPHIWGKIQGNPSTWHNQGLKHYNEIMNAPGKFIQVTNPRGIKFLEKWLPDGRGMRLNMDRTFKGFID